MKRMLAVILMLSLLLSMAPAAFAAETGLTAEAAQAAGERLQAGSDFYDELVEKYEEPDAKYHTEVRWWMPTGYHTDETILEELQAIHDAGFSGVELTQRSTSVDETVYGYGSDQWDHDFRLILNTALDLGMTVGVTAGTMSATANVPGLYPHSQEASQAVVQVEETVEAGKSRTGSLPVTDDIYHKARFLGAYAWLKSPVAINSSDTRYTMTKELDSALLDYTIETDLVIEKQSTGFCFGTKDSKNFIMWQINTKDQEGNILCKTHIRYNNAWKGRETIDVTEAVGCSGTEVIGKTIHMKIEVTDGTTIKTYFNNSQTPAFTFQVPADCGTWPLGDLMFRQATTSNRSYEELARYDNLVVRDADGKTVYENTFDDPSDPGFQGKNLKVVDGMLRVGVDQVPEAIANTVDAATIVDLSDKVVLNGDGRTGTLDWTAPADGSYTVMYYWVQTTADRWSPSVEKSYTVNYLDRRGYEALRAYWEEHILNDEALNRKIKESGAVQLFMDSLEYRTGKGFTLWSEDFDAEFQSRKGYDIKPYLFLSIGLPTLWGWKESSDIQGTYKLTDADLQQRVMNDLYDVQTELYMENFMTPVRQWLNSYGIKLRAQISYGKYLELSEPINVVDFPEAENRVQGNEPDLYRTWTGGAHLQNKILSSETGCPTRSRYYYTHQKHLQEAYIQYAVGFSREIWHSWAAAYGNEAVWPGFEVGSPTYYKLGTREPSYSEFVEFNDHLGRVQQLLREGKAAVDVGMTYIQYGQRLRLNKNDKALTHTPMFFPSETLQNNGYTYDYFAPDLLKADGVYYDAESGTLELAGYKAIVLWQDEMTLEGAQYLLDYAKQGLKIVIVDGAAVVTPYHDNSEAAMLAAMAEMKELPNVKCVAAAEDVPEALREMDVTPYAGYAVPNQQLLGQVRRDGENRFLYLYNYCNEILHESTHGTTIETEIVMDGIYQPYEIDAWSGEVKALAEYRHVDGKTCFDVSLDYGDVALYAFEPAAEATNHLTQTELDSELRDGRLFVRTTESGEHTVTLHTGEERTICCQVPEAYAITDWDLTVESWTPGEQLTRTETLFDVTTTEYAVSTVKTPIHVRLDTMTTWDKIPEIGDTVSGKGVYKAKFNWSGDADGAYLDLGSMEESTKIWINGKQTADINMNVPVVDVTDQLVVGENTIELHYSSNLTNVQLALGGIEEGPLAWSGYHVEALSYGPAQAVLVPYVEREVPVSEVALTVAGEEKVFAYAEDITYTVAAEGMDRLATAALTLSVPDLLLTAPVVEAAEGWLVLEQRYENGELTVMLASMEGVSGAGALCRVRMRSTGMEGLAQVAVSQAVLSAYLGDVGETSVFADLSGDSAQTKVERNVFDVNWDGVVNLLDVTRAQRFYGSDNEDADVNMDGTVDVDDLIMVLNNCDIAGFQG